jgi:uncharacterized protein
MYLDLLDVMRTPGKTTEKTIDIAPMTLDDIECVEPIRGVVRATNARRNIIVSGHAATAVAMQCSRCLCSYAQPMELDLEAVAPLSFFRAQAGGTGEETSAEDDVEDDELASLFDAHSVDVLELIRQAIVLQWPSKPLHAPDCPGLPEATKYMNDADDPRWHALNDWKDSNGSA